MNEEPSVCPMPKPHPTSVMKKTLAFMKKEHLPYEEAKERAKEEAIREGKFHGISKIAYDICQITRELEEEEKKKEK